MKLTGALLIPAAALVLIAGCGSSADPPGTSLPTPSDFSLAEELKAAPAVAPTPPSYPVLPPEPAGPLAIFGGDGTYVVGVDVLPGTYHTPGPAQEGLSCIWWRLSDTSGEQDAIIAADSSQGPVTLTIADSDAAVRTAGCAGWAKVD